MLQAAMRGILSLNPLTTGAIESEKELGNREMRPLTVTGLEIERFDEGISPTKFGECISTGIPARLNDKEKDDSNKDDEEGAGTGLATRTRTKPKKPSLYRVLLLNDDFTPMEFVVHVLERFFSKSREQATRIMLHVHNHGVGECGVFTFEVAETKVTQVMDFARKHQHPLQCVMEKK